MRIILLLVGILSARDRQNHKRGESNIATEPPITDAPLEDEKTAEEVVEPEIKDYFLNQYCSLKLNTQ